MSFLNQELLDHDKVNKQFNMETIDLVYLKLLDVCLLRFWLMQVVAKKVLCESEKSKFVGGG